MQVGTVGYIALAAVLVGTPLAIEQILWAQAAGDADGSMTSPALRVDAGRALTDITLGDVGADLVGVRLGGRSAVIAASARRQGALGRYTQIDASGVYGAGRGGAEHGHVFAAASGGWRAASSDGAADTLPGARRAEMPSPER